MKSSYTYEILLLNCKELKIYCTAELNTSLLNLSLKMDIRENFTEKKNVGTRAQR